MAHFTETAVLAAPADMALFIRDVQRCAVEICTEPEDIAPAVVPERVDTRQRTPGFMRFVNLSTAHPGVLQQEAGLPDRIDIIECYKNAISPLPIFFISSPLKLIPIPCS